MGIKVSVIIPVYNAEKHIAECIKSLLGQKLQECEFIFINDGSSDNSRGIIEQYKEIDDRIILIDQENQGVSMARNMGLSVATGEYIGFVDADDYVEMDMFETLYRSAKQDDCDVIVCNYETEQEGHKSITSYSFPTNRLLNKEYIEQKILPYFLERENLNAVWNKLFKKTVIAKHHVTFPEKVALGEDELFNIRFFTSAGSIKFLDYVGYHYKEVAGSATRNIKEKDYFGRALEVYQMDMPDTYLCSSIDRKKLRELKSIKFINCVMSYVHIYLSPSKDLDFGKRYRYVTNMISNEFVREALPIYRETNYMNLGRYERFIIDMIHKKSVLGLLLATTYSRLRNS